MFGQDPNSQQRMPRDPKRWRDTKATRGRDTKSAGQTEGNKQAQGARGDPVAGTCRLGLRKERGPCPKEGGLGQPPCKGSPLTSMQAACWLLHCLVVSIVTPSLARCPNIITTIQEESKLQVAVLLSVRNIHGMCT